MMLKALTATKAKARLCLALQPFPQRAKQAVLDEGGILKAAIGHPTLLIAGCLVTGLPASQRNTRAYPPDGNHHPALTPSILNPSLPFSPPRATTALC